MTTKVYSIDVRAYFTAYIKASSHAEARTIAKKLKYTTLDNLPYGTYGSAPPISGVTLDSPALPNVSLSPAVTLQGPDADAATDQVHPQRKGK